MGWFEEHTNKTLRITTIILGVLNLIGGFLGFLIVQMAGTNLLGMVVLVAFLFNLAILVSMSWSMYQERDIPMKDLVWLIIPSGLMMLLTLIGYKIFEAIHQG